MPDNLNHLKQIFCHLNQPALIVTNGVVTYCNHACAEYGLCEGDDIHTLLGEASAQYDACLPGDALQLPFFLSGQWVTVSIDRNAAWDTMFFPSPVPAGQAELFSAISNSLRHPLSNLIGATSLLFPLLEERENAAMQRKTAQMNQSLYQLMRATRNLGDLGQLLAGTLQLSPKANDIIHFFSALFENIELLCRRMNMSFRANCPSGPVVGMFDKALIERAVLNLFSNALKYAEPGANIFCHVEIREKLLTFRLNNGGAPVSAEIFSSLFCRWESISPIDDPRRGVGIGLPLTQEIARLHGGMLVMENRVNHGMTATFSFRLLPQEAPAVIRSPILDYSGGFDPFLTELSDILPADFYDSRGVN